MMATLAQSVPPSPQPLRWLWEFLKEELAPRPGRLGTVTRMVIAATLVMIIGMTFRIPYTFQGAIFALLISRESPRDTLQSGGIIFLFTGICAAYLLISASFVISVPVLHFLWVIGSLFVAFFALSAMSNYIAAVVFAAVISLVVPLWDRHVSAERNVEDTLRLVLGAAIGVVVTLAVELAFARRPGDDVVLPIAERLAAVQSLLACYAEGRPVDQASEEKVIRLAMRGTSSVRRLLRRSDYSLRYRGQMSGVAALAGRLIDLAATLTQLSFEPSGADRTRLRNLAEALASIRDDLMNHRIPSLIQSKAGDEPARGVPLLHEIENTVTLIPQAFTGSRELDVHLPSSDDMPRSKLFAADAFVNPDHLKFALKGCLSASLCYIIYNAVAWPGISTAVTTCLLTALSTIGASRQKQVLRLAGAVVGGFLLGMGSQVFILPYVDSIGGFLVLFVFVTALSSWFLTASPRLSYFGLQVALAYYLINVQEFAIQTSISIARDRVVGVLFGLFMMWLIFDQLWSAPAAVEMKRAFASALRLLAQLAREPVSKDIRAAIKTSFVLREMIDAEFDKGRSLADGVLFEFGPSRQQNLLSRDRIRRWQPQVRTLFLMRVASLKYRLRLRGFELPEAVRLYQQEYDERSAQILEDMADRVEGKPTQAKRITEDASKVLGQILHACHGEESHRFPAVHINSFVALLREIDRLTATLAGEIAAEEGRS